MKRSREPEEYAEPTASSGDPGPAGGNEGSLPALKLVELDPSEESSVTGVEMRCSLPPHPEGITFRSYSEFESHYNSYHTNRCIECSKSFPSQHMLNLHHEECHDAFVALRRESGEQTYSCFVEGCDRKCRTPQKRRMHLIDKHMFPKNYFYAVTREGITGRRSMLLEGGHRRRRSSTATDRSRRRSLTNPEMAKDSMLPDIKPTANPHEAKSGQAAAPDVTMDELSGAMSALQFIPKSVQFGRGGRKAGFQKR